MRRILILTIAGLLFATPALAQQADRSVAQAQHALALLEAQVDQTNHAFEVTQTALAALANDSAAQKAQVEGLTKVMQDLQARMQWWENPSNRQWVDGKKDNAP